VGLRKVFSGLKIAAFAIILVGCQTSGPVGISAAPNTNLVIGNEYTGAVKFGNVQIQLTEGNWTLVSFLTYRTNNNSVIYWSTFGQIKNGIISDLIWARTNEDPSQYGWLDGGVCARNDIHIHFLEVTSYGQQKCYGIHDITFSTPRKGNLEKMRADVEAWSEKNNAKMINYAIGASYSLEGGGNFLRLTYAKNPVAYNFPDENGSWEAHPWNRSNVASDGAKKAYVNKAIQWAKLWYPKVNSGFGG
jgi:hypothetical protein